MYKEASTLLDKAQSYLNENPGLTKALLLGGGVGGLGGFLATGKEEEDDEHPGRRFMRRLRNALIGAGIGAGAGALMNSGTREVAEALPADDIDPVTEAATSPISRVLGATGAGSLAGWGQHHYKHNNAATMLGVNEVKDFDKIKNPVAALNKYINDVATARKTGTTKDLTGIAEKINNTLNGSEEDMKYWGKRLTSAGASTAKLEGTAMDTQSKLPGKLQDLLSHKGLNWAKGPLRHLKRNKFVYPAAALGLLAPEVGGTLYDWYKGIMGGDELS